LKLLISVIILDSINIGVIMSDLLNIIITISVLSVALVLVLGLANMLKKGSANKSQKLMRFRVVAQFIAVVLIMIFFYFNY
jgi:hypothetical protein